MDVLQQLEHGTPQESLLATQSQSHRISASEKAQLLQALASGAQSDSASIASDMSVGIEVQLAGVKQAHVDAEETLHNSEAEGDMLQTMLLANGENLLVIKKLAETVAKMKAQVEILEGHEKLCKKKLADLKNSEAEQQDAQNMANSVQVVTEPTPEDSSR